MSKRKRLAYSDITKCGVLCCLCVNQQKLHVTLELNAQMQKELDEKEEKIRILEAKNETLSRTADAKADEIENLKEKISMLEQEVCSRYRK